MKKMRKLRKKRLRRTGKQVLLHGPSAKSKHAVIGGRSGQIRCKRKNIKKKLRAAQPASPSG